MKEIFRDVAIIMGVTCFTIMTALAIIHIVVCLDETNMNKNGAQVCQDAK